MHDARPLPRLSDHGRHVVRYWRRLVVLAVLGAAVGGAVYWSADERYLATAQVALSPQISYVSISTDNERQPLVTLDTTAQLARSDASLDRIAAAMEVSRTEASESLAVSARPLARVLVLHVTADTARQAEAGSYAATEALVEAQASTFALSPDRVRLLKNRLDLVLAQAQESVAEGQPSQALFESSQILQTRLDRAVATNNTDTQVITRGRVTAYRPGEAEVLVMSGLATGLALALLSAGPPAPTTDRRRLMPG